jgi:hypothetical protein
MWVISQLGGTEIEPPGLDPVGKVAKQVAAGMG